MSEGGTMRIEQKKLLVITTLKTPIVGSITGNSRLFSHRLAVEKWFTGCQVAQGHLLFLISLSLSHFFALLIYQPSLVLFSKLYLQPRSKLLHLHFLWTHIKPIDCNCLVLHIPIKNSPIAALYVGNDNGDSSSEYAIKQGDRGELKLR